ncbi:hypothetical protein EMCRGX_G019418 [Ephydatia muelleri]
MAPALSKYLFNPRALGAGAAIAASLAFYLARRSGGKSRESNRVLSKGSSAVSKERAAVDLTFFRRLWPLLKIIVPGAFSPEAGYLVLIAVMLVLRTYADVWMIQNGTNVEASIIGRDIAGFKEHLLRFIYAMPLISLVTNLLKYGLNELKLRFRTRLSLYLYSRYLRGFTFYKMTNLDNRIANADQLLTQDVDKFCDTLAELYSNISKPILDICLYVYRLTDSIGAQGPVTMLIYLAISGLVLTRLRAPVGRMTVKEQQLEGELRFVNSRLITNSEEISFYQGSDRERVTVERTFGRLVDHLRNFIMFRFGMGIIDTLIAKYIATVVGYLAVSRPFLTLSNPRFLESTHDARMMEYYKSGRMLVRMAEAIGRLVLAGREMTRLAGFTARVSELTMVLRDIEKGTYKRTMVATTESTEKGGPSQPSVPLVPGMGELVEMNHLIKFEGVPLVTPNGDVLIKELNFEVKSGVNVLVCGPNGCGKSSLFRTLGELWPLFGGRMTKPHRSKLFYIPQRPYMTLGTLRDQVIYPDTLQDYRQKGITDGALEEYLKMVQLSYLLDRDGGWDAEQDWMDVLSGGEKQRMAMARLFYHEPQFAILDECTSAVSVDVEGFIYTHCRERGITLFTVSHRKSLWKHHEYVLQFDGRGQYEFKPIDSTTEEFGS